MSIPSDNRSETVFPDIVVHLDGRSIHETRVFQSDLLLKFESVNSLTI